MARLYAPDGIGTVNANNADLAVPALQTECDQIWDWIVLNHQDWIDAGMTEWDHPRLSGSRINRQFVPDGNGWYFNYDDRIHDALTYEQRLLIVPSLEETPPA